jgi:hypothetical protein
MEGGNAKPFIFSPRHWVLGLRNKLFKLKKLNPSLQDKNTLLGDGGGGLGVISPKYSGS